ncbi:MAG: guanylate kinase [Oscillospiraceae bacterium]|nr:guanylate kinase [Oscillospiraceae bacterium]
MKKGMLIVISGPAGCGKDTVVEGLLNAARRGGECGELFYSVSATTRIPRSTEENGIHYHFKTREEFERLIEQDEFLEYTDYCGNYYGTLKKTVMSALDKGQNLILKIEVEGAANIRRIFADLGALSKFVAIFIMPPSLEELRRRLINRDSEDAATIELRVKTAAEEIALAGHYDYRVVNDVLETAIDEIASIIARHNRENDELKHPLS